MTRASAPGRERDLKTSHVCKPTAVHVTVIDCSVGFVRMQRLYAFVTPICFDDFQCGRRIVPDHLLTRHVSTLSLCTFSIFFCCWCVTF